MTDLRRRKLAALAKLRKRAAYAPRGLKMARLKQLQKTVHAMLREELTRNV